MKPLIILFAIITTSALAADFPLSDPTDSCRRATRMAGTAAFNYCVNQEQLYYDLAKSDWLIVSDKNKSYCLNYRLSVA
jgi:hypothetical protein